MKASEIEPGKVYKGKTSYPWYGAVVRARRIVGDYPSEWTPYIMRHDGVRCEILQVCSRVTTQHVGDFETHGAGSLDHVMEWVS